MSYQFKKLFIPSKDNNYSPKFLESNALLYCIVFLLILKIMTIGIFMPWPKNIFFADITKIALVDLLNQNRQTKGLQPLSESYKLNQAASLKAKDMVSKNYFAHQSPQGVTPWFWFQQAGYNYKYAGENLAVGFFNSDEVFNAWLNSSSHKANMVNPNYKEVGTAVLNGFGDNNAIIVVQFFGSSAIVASEAANEDNTNPIIADESPVANVSSNTDNGDVSDNVQVKTEIEDSAVVDDQKESARKIFGQSIQISQLSPGDPKLGNNFYVQFINFIVYDNGKLIIYISYLLLAVIGVSLLFNFAVNFNRQPKFIFRSITLIAILCGAIFIDKDLVSQIISYQITI